MPALAGAGGLAALAASSTGVPGASAGDFINPDPATPAAPGTTLADILTYLKLGLTGLGLVGGLGGSGSGSGAGGTIPAGFEGAGKMPESFKTDRLPTGADVPAFGGGTSLADRTARDMSGTDWNRYGFNPEKSFFNNVPQRAANGASPLPVAEKSFFNNVPQRAANGASPLPVAEPPSYTVVPHSNDRYIPPTEIFAANGAPPLAALPVAKVPLPPNLVAPPEKKPMAVKRPSKSFAVQGAGDGRSDDIPAVLSDGEYVMDAETVALLGNGSNKAGAAQLDRLRANMRKHKGKELAKGRFSVNAKNPQAYMAGGRT